jgi:quercetin dioxygenase-like cupin family protein
MLFSATTMMEVVRRCAPQKWPGFPRHTHNGREEIVVLSGNVLIGGVELSQGDYLYTQPGEEHEVIALADAIIFVSSQKSTPVVG